MGRRYRTPAGKGKARDGARRGRPVGWVVIARMHRVVRGSRGCSCGWVRAPRAWSASVAGPAVGVGAFCCGSCLGALRGVWSAGLRAVRAAEGAIDRGEDLGETVGVGDVTLDWEGFAAELGDGVGGGFDAGGVAVEEDEVGAGFGEGGGPGAAHALGGSGDDGDAVVEVEEVHGGRGAGG